MWLHFDLGATLGYPILFILTCLVFPWHGFLLISSCCSNPLSSFVRAHMALAETLAWFPTLFMGYPLEFYSDYSC
jgi:hypothetical protein